MERTTLLYSTHTHTLSLSLYMYIYINILLLYAILYSILCTIAILSKGMEVSLQHWRLEGSRLMISSVFYKGLG